MNSTIKPPMTGAGPQPGAQPSPAKGSVAGMNHAPAAANLGVQNSVPHNQNSNNGNSANAHHPPMPPVSHSMAQMAQNMSHHGNFSHHNQNSNAVNPPAPASPAKNGSPLSLVQDKVGNPSQSSPLALTRTPEKKEPGHPAQANGTVESPKIAQAATHNAKAAQTPEPSKPQESPSTPKQADKPVSATTPQKPEQANSSTQNSTPQAATPEKPSVKEAPKVIPPTEIKAVEPKVPEPEKAITAPAQSVATPQIPPKEGNTTANPKPVTPVKQDNDNKDSQPPAPFPKVETSPEKKPITPQPEKQETPKKSEPEKPMPEKKVTVPNVEAKPALIESKAPAERAIPKKPEMRTAASVKSTLKLATVTPTAGRKRRQESKPETPSTSKATEEHSSQTPDGRSSKRSRTQVQPYQSPTPELAMATKLSASAGRSTPTKSQDEKLIVFYKNEYLAVRNAEGGFYVCQAMQNVYRHSRKIKIRWLSQDKTLDPQGNTYKPDFYDTTDMECVLTTLSMSRGTSKEAMVLAQAEAARASSILQRAIGAETGAAPPSLDPHHPDGLDLSLYTSETQLEKKKGSRKRTASNMSKSPQKSPSKAEEKPTPAKKPTPGPKAEVEQDPLALGKQGRASASKTITPPAKSSKDSGKKGSAAKPAVVPRPESPKSSGTPKSTRPSRRESKPAPAPAPVPSTSTGKTARSSRRQTK